MELHLVSITKPDDANIILGQTHVIKTVEDLHEALVGAVPASCSAWHSASKRCTAGALLGRRCGPDRGGARERAGDRQFNLKRMLAIVSQRQQPCAEARTQFTVEPADGLGVDRQCAERGAADRRFADSILKGRAIGRLAA